MVHAELPGRVLRDLFEARRGKPVVVAAAGVSAAAAIVARGATQACGQISGMAIHEDTPLGRVKRVTDREIERRRRPAAPTSIAVAIPHDITACEIIARRSNVPIRGHGMEWAQNYASG